MKVATVSDLGDKFDIIEGWLGLGEEIQIQKAGKPIATLKAIPKGETAFQLPDFEARRKAIWGDRVFSEEEVRAMKEDELEGLPEQEAGWTTPKRKVATCRLKPGLQAFGVPALAGSLLLSGIQATSQYVVRCFQRLSVSL